MSNFNTGSVFPSFQNANVPDHSDGHIFTDTFVDIKRSKPVYNIGFDDGINYSMSNFYTGSDFLKLENANVPDHSDGHIFTDTFVDIKHSKPVYNIGFDDGINYSMFNFYIGSDFPNFQNANVPD